MPLTENSKGDYERVDAPLAILQQGWSEVNERLRR